MTRAAEAPAPRVLVVDDEAHMLSAMRRSLRREGYELLTAGSGDQALRVLARGPVDAIVSDHKMPGMSGLQLLARAAQRCPDAARLLITGWPGEIPAAELERLGVCALISKPWQDAKLKATLRRALGRGGR